MSPSPTVASRLTFPTFEITVLDVNDAPTDITLDNNTIAENQPADTVVGKFTLVDPDLDDDATTGGGTGQFDFTEGPRCLLSVQWECQ